MIRANLLEATNEDYVRTARAKGLSEWATLRRHTFRNAVLPIVAMVGMDVGLAFAGSLFVERAFRIPGIGTLTITSLQRRDLPVLLGVVVVVVRRDRRLQPDRRPRAGRARSQRVGGRTFRARRSEPRAPVACRRAESARAGARLARLSHARTRHASRYRRPRSARQRSSRHLEHRLDDDRAVHLRLADAPVDERDRDLDHGEAGPQRAVGRLDLEAVAPGRDRVEVDRLQDARAGST